MITTVARVLKIEMSVHILIIYTVVLPQIYYDINAFIIQVLKLLKLSIFEKFLGQIIAKRNCLPGLVKRGAIILLDYTLNLWPSILDIKVGVKILGQKITQRNCLGKRAIWQQYTIVQQALGKLPMQLFISKLPRSQKQSLDFGAQNIDLKKFSLGKGTQTLQNYRIG